MIERFLAVVIAAITSLLPLANGATTAPIGGAPLPAGARFACYPAHFSPFRPRLLRVSNQFARGSVLATVPETVCAPAPGASTGYLICYTIAPRTPLVTPKSLRAYDEFAKFIVRFSKLLAICVPSARVDTGGSSATTKGLDSFTCYAAKASARAPGVVSVGDDFGASQDTIRVTNRFCIPTSWSGTGIEFLRASNRSRFLNCYLVQSETKGTTVIAHNNFGYLKAAVGPRTSLCATAQLLS
jgi:hypothetical protein